MNKRSWRILFLSLLLLVFTAQIVGALPPRPDEGETAVSGAFIQLQLSNGAAGPGGVWTLIQWQGVSGDWHTIDGWQGTVELDGTQTWWLDSVHLGTGPFRWRVLTGKDGSLLATSDSFYMPKEAGITLPVPLIIE